MKTHRLAIGIDVAKAKLDYAVPAPEIPCGKREVKTTTNDKKGFAEILRLAKKHSAAVCMEPTGGYEKSLAAHLLDHGAEVYLAAGERVRHFAKAMGFDAKNDAIDARMIAAYAESGAALVRPKALTPEREELRSLARHRAALVSRRVMVANAMEKEPLPTIRKLLAKELRGVEKLLEEVDAAIESIVAGDESLSSIVQRCTAVKGIGVVTATTVLAECPELGEIGDAGVVRLAGLAPIERQSGFTDRARHIAGGRKRLRNALYMAAVSAVRSNRILREIYLRKKSEGFAGKSALVVVMRKLLLLMNRIAAKSDWCPATA